MDQEAIDSPHYLIDDGLCGVLTIKGPISEADIPLHFMVTLYLLCKGQDTPDSVAA
jgi:hypothetical protein